MRALVTGATGFIGRHLVRKLDNPVVLTRDTKRALEVLGTGVSCFNWPAAGEPPPEAFRDVDVVFHLAGEGVAEGRWTAAKKQRIRESRVDRTRALVSRFSALGKSPNVLVSASAIGYYGSRGDEALDESSSPGNDFLAEVCQAWEGEARSAMRSGVRVVTVRTGIVLGRGGALAKMLTPFKMGLGGRLGDGEQWMSWIHIDDHVGLLLFAAGQAELSGPLNSVAPTPERNREFTRKLSTVLRRPALFPVPRIAVRLAFGEVASVLLASQRVVPRIAEKAGYRFRYTALEEALRAAIAQT